jgi:signal transduction histidine kinase
MTARDALDLLPRPLDPIRSVKLKMSLLLFASGAVGVAYLWHEYHWVPPYSTIVIAFVIVIGTALLLSHGMTRPLREMTAASREMARGDYSRRVRATSRDEVGELAEAFNRMAADLDAADRRRRELIANVSHELRTPIAALHAVLENVVDGVADADPTTLQTALAQTQRLGRLVTELLDLSRIDAGASALDKHVIDVAALVDAAVAEVKVAAAVAGRDVRFDVDVTPGTRAEADAGRLQQVVVNLLDNAARHAPPGTAVGVVGRTGTRGELVLDVVDTGPGIAAAERATVFHRFTRGERAQGGGTGLGLSIARWVVDMHGGTIAVLDPGTTAHPERPGCRIRVTLPATSVGSSV